MSQHDFSIANQGFPSFRSDLNDGLQALVSNSSGATAPSTTYAHQFWVDTAADPSILKVRNADNDAWITLGNIDQTGDTFIFTPAAGSASAPAYTTSGDLNTGVFFPGADRVGITTAGTQRIEVDASGNVGIGTSSPATKFHVSGQSRVADSSNAANYMTFGVGANAPYGNASISTTTAGLSIVAEGAGNMTFLNNGSERARIDSSGNVGIGTDSPNYALHIKRPSGTATSVNLEQTSVYSWEMGMAASGAALLFKGSGTERARIDSSGNLLVGTTSVLGNHKLNVRQTAAQPVLSLQCTGSDYTAMATFYSASGSVKGSIGATPTTVSYNTSSDYRLKENVVGVTGAAARVQQLNPVRFNFIVDPDTTVDGFLAHEVQDVVPEAISGTKDAVDAEGNPVYQGIDQSKLVPLLTAALQEALTKIDSLETRIAALEGN